MRLAIIPTNVLTPATAYTPKLVNLRRNATRPTSIKLIIIQNIEFTFIKCCYCT